VTDDASKEENGGVEQENCVKGSRIRKAVPPPVG